MDQIPTQTPQPIPQRGWFSRYKILVLFLVFIAILGVGYLLLPTLLHTFAGQDRPPPNDKDLKLGVVLIPKGENAFYDLEKLNGMEDYDPKIPNGSFSLKTVRGEIWDQKLAEETVQKNQALLNQFTIASTKNDYQNPHAADLYTY